MWLIQSSSNDVRCVTPQTRGERARKSREIAIWCLFQHLCGPVPPFLESDNKSSRMRCFDYMWANTFVFVRVCVFVFCIFYSVTCPFVGLEIGKWISLTNRPFHFLNTLTRISNRSASSGLLTSIRTSEFINMSFDESCLLCWLKLMNDQNIKWLCVAEQDSTLTVIDGHWRRGGSAVEMR